MAEYHNADRQQQFKDKLLSTFQDENETPVKFYSRIREIVQSAGYPDMATQNLVAENTFMQGLLPKYAYAIRIAPTILNLNQKVEYANRIYTSGRTSGNTQVPVPLPPSRISVQPTTVAPIPLPAPPMNQPVAPVPATDPVMDRLAEEFARLTAHLVNRDRRNEQRRPVQRFNSDYPRRNEYQGGYRNQQNNNADRFLTCWNCGEEGHQARHCRTETSRQAQPSNATRRQANLMQPQEIFDSEDEWEDYEAYIGKRGRDMEEEDGPQEESSRKRARTPPPRKQRPVTSRIRRRIPAAEPRPVEVETRQVEEPQVNWEVQPEPVVEEVQQDSDMEEATPAPRSESQKERKLRKSRTYMYDAWEDMKGRQVQMTFEQAAQLNPTLKQQLRRGLSDVKPGWKITEVKATAQTEDSDEERRTSAYTTCTIEDCVVEAIVDSGAGGSMIAKPLLDRLGWGIEEPTRMKFTTANGETATPLGLVRDIPIRFGGVTIPINAVVVQTTTYEIILGNDWLKKAKASIDYNSEKMKITWKGRSWLIPFNVDKGVRPEYQEEEEEAFIARTTERRFLTGEEKERMYHMMMIDNKCAFCGIRVYCAEDCCNCPNTIKIMANETLEALWNRRQPKRRRRAPSPKQELVPTFYSKLPSFDDCEEGSYQWDLFWKNAPYIGRGRFMKDRDSYDQNGVAWRNERPPRSIAYWDDVDPNDFHMVQQRSAIPANVIIVRCDETKH